MLKLKAKFKLKTRLTSKLKLKLGPIAKAEGINAIIKCVYYLLANISI